jgi:hypothetical protein
MKFIARVACLAAAIAFAPGPTRADTDADPYNHYILDCDDACNEAIVAGSIRPGFTGGWYDPAQSGHGLFIEVLPESRVQVTWFSFNPEGTSQAWFVGSGTYAANKATISAVVQPTGGRFVPNFDPNRVTPTPWGSLKLTFSDCAHGVVEFMSTAGYGVGSMRLERLTLPAGLACQ